MSSMFVEGTDNEGQKIFFFIEDGKKRKKIHSVQLTEVSDGAMDICLIPKLGQLSEEEKFPRVIIENEIMIIDLNNFVPYYPTPLSVK
ncbi:MAG: hypothetical protein WCX30_00625 [Candidatus Paceibacterota bacterium]|jgi:hypothetical protein|nr:hypothetical protein [bacterium]